VHESPREREWKICVAKILAEGCKAKVLSATGKKNTSCPLSRAALLPRDTMKRAVSTVFDSVAKAGVYTDESMHLQSLLGKPTTVDLEASTPPDTVSGLPSHPVESIKAAVKALSKIKHADVSQAMTNPNPESSTDLGLCYDGPQSTTLVTDIAQAVCAADRGPCLVVVPGGRFARYKAVFEQMEGLKTVVLGRVGCGKAPTENCIDGRTVVLGESGVLRSAFFGARLHRYKWGFVAAGELARSTKGAEQRANRARCTLLPTRSRSGALLVHPPFVHACAWRVANPLGRPPDECAEL